MTKVHLRVDVNKTKCGLEERRQQRLSNEGHEVNCPKCRKKMNDDHRGLPMGVTSG